jgi:galactokinase
MNPTAAIVAKAFAQQYSTTPNLYFSPGRINLIGEHVDYNDGFVLPAAINKGMYYAIAANQTTQINFFAADFDEKFSIEITDVKKSTGWRNYVLSVVNEFVLLNINIGGFDCVFGGDIPIGSGMSSSAAVEGGLAFALNEIFETALSRRDLALLCQRAEHNYPNVHCGIMDMYANLLGKKGQVILLDCKVVEHEYFPLPLEGYCIVMINSKVQHSLASGEYNIRRQRCEAGMKVLATLGVQSFRDEGIAEKLEAFKNQMDAAVYNCCKYVIEEIARTKKAVQLLAENDLKAFGKLMYATHEGLSKLYEVSCPELDFLVAYAAATNYVVGSRLMGGGFGGCSINIVPKETAASFIEAVSTAYFQQFAIQPEAYILEISNGVERLEN